MSSPLFTNLTVQNGLPSDAMTALAQDKNGFVWVGTQSGLARFDGYGFKSFHHDQKDPASLPGDYISTLYSDKAGTLWVGTATDGLARLDRGHDSFTHFDSSALGLSTNNITAIMDDAASGLWVGTDKGLIHLSADGHVIARYHRVDHDQHALPDEQINTLLLTPDNALWIGTASGLVRRAADSEQFQRVPILESKSPAPVADIVSTIVRDVHGKIWFGTDDHGIGFVDAAGHARLLNDGSTTATEMPLGVRAIALVGDNLLWIATYGAGLYIFDTGTGEFRHLQHAQSNSLSLVDDQSLALLHDMSGLLWIATEQGLSVTDPSNDAIENILSDETRPDRLAEPNALGLMLDSRGWLWVGYHNHGLDAFDGQGKRVASNRPNNGPTARQGDSLRGRTVTSFAEGKDGTIWVGSTKGLYRTDQTANQVTAVPTPGSEHYPYVQTLRTYGRDLWVGSNSGLFRLSGKTNQWTTYLSTDKNGLSDNRITGMVPAPEHRFWIGTLHGLNLFNPDDGSAVRIFADAADASGLKNNYVVDLGLDKHGRLWVATGGDGLFVLEGYDPQGKPRFRQIGVNEGLPNANVDAIGFDSVGFAWISMDDGLARINPETFQIRGFRRAEGVYFRSYWNESTAVSATGEILFGGLGGISVVNPRKLVKRNLAPPLVITDVRVGTKTIPSMRLNGDKLDEPIFINPEERGFQFEFATLDFLAPERIRYAYKLEGFDRDWIDTDSSRRIAAYTNLPPGDYRLLIKGSNREGDWMKRQLAVPIHVEPAWYQTWIARIAEALLLVAIFLLLVRARTAYLHGRQRELEEVIASRTRELEYSKRQLEKIAFLDALTNLPNRRFFIQRLDDFTAQAARHGRAFALLMVDLDKFKSINDTYGHDAGDAVLVEASRRLLDCIRDVDCLARLGGDEFAILLDSAHSEDLVEIVCKRILAAFALPVVSGGLSLQTSATIGAVLWSPNLGTQKALYKAADLALYEAKRAGRNTWRFVPAGTAPASGTVNDDATRNA